MNKAVGIIPARWNSTRFPGKPLHLVAGKPLLLRVLERCRCAKNLDSLIIATDDMRIAHAAFDWGAEVSLTSGRHRSGTDRVAEVARKAKEFGYVINIQGDEPLVDPSGRALYFSRAAIPFPRNLSGIKYLRHQGIYGFRRDTLLQFVKWKPTPLERSESLEQLRALENGVSVHVLVIAKGSPGVDTPEDANALEQKLARAERR